MKKFISIILALILVLSSTVVFADSGKGNGSNGKGNDKKYYDKKDFNDKSIKALKEILEKYNKGSLYYKEGFDERCQEYINYIIRQILALKNDNKDDSTSIYINGIDYSSNLGNVIKYKNFQLPTKPITEGLGAKLNWNSKTHTITITKDNITLVMNLDTKKVMINGSEVKNSVLTSNNKNKTIVLIKYIAEVFGKKAEIDEGTGAVIVEEDGTTSINDNIIGKGLNQFQYSKKWNYETQTNAFLGDNHSSTTRDAYYSVRFNGTQIKLYGATSPKHGIAAVSIDNGPETYVDLYSAKRVDNALVFSSPLLNPGEHTLKVRVTGNKNTKSIGTYVTADRVNILPNSTPQGGTNIALNKYSFSDSQQPENIASKGNDGNTSTRWCAADGSFNHWWTVDLGGLYNLSGSQVSWEKAGKVYKYKVEVSTDNTNWTLKADKTSSTVAQQIQSDSFNANGVRYVRITVTGLESGCWASFSEFKVFGSNSNTDTQAPTVPTGLIVTAPTAYEALLKWTASTDNVGIAGYKIFRNGNQIGTVTSGTSFRDSGLTPETVYVYSVVAYDAAGNLSNHSSFAIITTPTSTSNGNGLKGEYYNNKDLTDLKFTRIDDTINSYWNNVSPDSRIDKETFSIRWTGQIQPLYSEKYTFYTTSDDGVRLWVNGSKIIDNWNDHSALQNSGTITLVAGQKYDIQLDYYNNLGEGKIRLDWSSNSQAKQIVPKSQLFSVLNDTKAPTAPVGLTATAVSSNQIDLSWTASTDDVGVIGYRIIRNGTLIDTLATTTTYSDKGLTADTLYSYQVLAYDAAGNSSNHSTPISATTKKLNNINLALGKTATSDSEENANPASKGNDGNINTRWCASDGAFNHWWKVDLGSNYNLTGTEVIWEKNKAYKYKIEVSTDGSNWTLAVDKTRNTNVAQTQTDSFTANSVRYVKITVTGFDSDCWASFNEFKVY